MKPISACSLAVLSMVWAGPSLAFQNGQHQKISQTAISAAAASSADIQKFGPLINSWSWGIGGYSNLSGIQEISLLISDTGNPSEELAHLEDQRRLINATANRNGGDYIDILNNQLRPRYLANELSSGLASQEGAYVWMGAALHLIEDQASPPHGANILHSFGDKFEGPATELGIKQKSFIFTTSESQNKQLSDLYDGCLTATRDSIPNLKDSGSPEAQYWLLGSGGYPVHLGCNVC